MKAHHSDSFIPIFASWPSGWSGLLYRSVGFFKMKRSFDLPLTFVKLTSAFLIAVALASSFGMVALGQVSTPIYNHTFEGSDLTGWGTAGVISSVARAACTPATGDFLLLDGASKWLYHPMTEVPAGYVTTEGQSQTVVTVRFDGVGCDRNASVQTRWADGTSGRSSSSQSIGRVDMPTTWTSFDTLTNPPITLTLPHGTTHVRVGFQTISNPAAVDNFGPIVFTNSGITPTPDPETDEPEPDVPEDTSIDLTGVVDAVAAIPDYGDPLTWVAAGDSLLSDLDFDDAVDAFEAFRCGDPLDFIAQKAGGGGLLKKILGFIKSIAASQLGIAEGSAALNCKADVANEIAQDDLTIQQQIESGQTDVIDLPPNAEFNAPFWETTNSSFTGFSDAVDTELSNLESGVEDDNLITSSARTNRLLVASVRMQAVNSDRMFGTEPPKAYARSGSGSRRITSQDASDDDFVEYAEGDIAGTVDTIGLQAEGVEPDWEEKAELDPADAEYQGVGACLALGAVPPSGEGTALAISTLQWNASQRLASSNMGNFICSIIDQPSRNAIDLCLTKGLDFTETLGATPLAQSNDDLCIYGPQAPSWSNLILNAFPFILLVFASISVLKRFI